MARFKCKHKCVIPGGRFCTKGFEFELKDPKLVKAYTDSPSFDRLPEVKKKKPAGPTAAEKAAAEKAAAEKAAAEKAALEAASKKPASDKIV